MESCVARGWGGGPGEGQVTVLGCAHQVVVDAPAVDRGVALGAPTNWWQLLQGARQGPVSSRPGCAHQLVAAAPVAPVK